jgi:hypothetical protein
VWAQNPNLISNLTYLLTWYLTLDMIFKLNINIFICDIIFKYQGVKYYNGTYLTPHILDWISLPMISIECHFDIQINIWGGYLENLSIHPTPIITIYTSWANIIPINVVVNMRMVCVKMLKKPSFVALSQLIRFAMGHNIHSHLKIQLTFWPLDQMWSSFKKMYVCTIVATPLWPSVRIKLTLLELGIWSPSGLPNLYSSTARGKNTLPWGVLSIIGKILKCRCPKWPHISHLDICSPSYGQKKGRESNCQFDSRPFDSRPLKVRNRPAPDVRWGSATWRWKALEENYKFGSDLVPIGGQGEKLSCPKVPGVQNRDTFETPLWEYQEKVPFECKCGGEAQRII